MYTIFYWLIGVSLTFFLTLVAIVEIFEWLNGEDEDNGF